MPEDGKRMDEPERQRNRLPTAELFDLVPSVISIHDLDFRIRQINRSFRAVFGDRLGEYCYRVYKGRSEVCLDCPMAKTFRDGRVHESEEVVRTRDAQMVQMAVQTAPLFDGAGRVVGGMEVGTDISRTVASQQEMVLLGQAMASMAHHVKNIVTGLEGGIFVVEEGLATDNEEQLHEGWEMVRRNIERVTKLAHDQLFCSRDRPPEKRLVDPNSIVCEAVQLYRDRAAKNGVDLLVEPDRHAPEMMLDPNGFHDLLTNLISNALDACIFDTATRSHWVSVKSLLEPSGEFRLEVADNGQGIPSDMCSEVFTEMFSSKGRTGTGLGLLVVYRVVSAHGGQINVLSDEDVGTVFNIVLPLCDSP